MLAAIGLLFLPVIQTENQHKAERANLQNEITAAQIRQDQLELETKLMKTNPAYVEHIARDRLNMGKPGETIIRFDKYQSSSPNSNSVDTDSSL